MPGKNTRLPPEFSRGSTKKPKRLSLDISPEVETAIVQLGVDKGVPKAEVTRLALTSYLENLGYESYFRHEDISGEKIIKRINIRSAKQVLFHSQLLIRVFEETLDYEPSRHHNQPPPELRVEDDEYLEELRKLVSELKQLNVFLADMKKQHSGRSGNSTALQKHLNTFWSKYAGTLGTGAGVLTLGAIAALLHQLGASEAIFDQVMKRMPGR